MNKIWNSLGLAVLGIALLVGSATATDMQVDGQLTESVDVTVNPTSIDTWGLVVGSNTLGSTVGVTMSANLEASRKATLSAKETASGSNTADGKMHSSLESHALGDELQLDVTSPLPQANSIAALSGTSQDMYVMTAPSTILVSFNYKQAVAYTDPASDDYGILVTFTGTLADNA